MKKLKRKKGMDRAYSIMKEELGDKLEQLRVGLVIEF